MFCPVHYGGVFLAFAVIEGWLTWFVWRHSHEGPHRFWMSRIVDSRKAQIKIIFTLAIIYSSGARVKKWCEMQNPTRIHKNLWCVKTCFTGRCTTIIWSSEKNEQMNKFSLKNLSITLFNKVFSDHDSWGRVHAVSNVFKAEYVTRHTFPVTLLSLSLDVHSGGVSSFWFCFGLSRVLCVCVCVVCVLTSFHCWWFIFASTAIINHRTHCG